MRLSDYAVGRDNNFNLLRLTAALIVIYAHSFAVLGLPPNRSVTFGDLSVAFSDFALDTFFVTSGFLVSGSLVGRGSLINFLWARGLRIYPALWVMLVVTVFGLAPMLTTLPPGEFLTSGKTWDYFVKCATLLGGVRWSLPGVFETLPLKGEFNGSLWTLPVEVRLYLYLAGAWLILALAPAWRLRALSWLAPAAAALIFAQVVYGRVFGGPFNPADIRVYMFFAGSAIYLWRARLPLGWGVFAAIVAALAVAAVHSSAFFVAYLILFPAVVMHLAYLPKGPLLAFNRWGDFSYGVYIYGFPIQQTLAFLFPAMPLMAMMAASSGASLIAGALSWRLLEKRALALKGPAAAATERALRNGLTKFAVAAPK